MSWYNPDDGKRFVAGIQKKGESDTYTDFYESNVESEAKKQAKDLCESKGMKSIVFDRGGGIVARFLPSVKVASVMAEPDCPKKVKRK